MRVIAFALFLLLIAEPVYAWLVLGRFLIKPVARISTVAFYQVWVKAGRPAWNFVKSPVVLQGATIGLGVVAVGDILSRFRELEKEATKTLDLQDGKVYRFYCVRAVRSTGSCFSYQGCSRVNAWVSSNCYGSPQPLPHCRDGYTEQVLYRLAYARYVYENGRFRRISYYVHEGLDYCAYGCRHTWIDEYGLCPDHDTPPETFTVNNIPFSTPPVEDATLRPVERSVDTQVVEQLITERIGNQVKKDREVFVFPNISSLAERISQEFPNVSQEEAQEGLEGVKDESQAPDVPSVGSDVVIVEVAEIIDTHTGSRSDTGSDTGSRSDARSDSRDISIPIPSNLAPSLPHLERLPFPLQLVQSLAQNHPLIRLISGVSVSCGGSCSVPIAFSGGVLSVNTSLDFCPFEGVLSFVGSVLLAFVPLIWLFARRD